VPAGPAAGATAEVRGGQVVNAGAQPALGDG
jgi:hypothetical protein